MDSKNQRVDELHSSIERLSAGIGVKLDAILGAIKAANEALIGFGDKELDNKLKTINYVLERIPELESGTQAMELFEGMVNQPTDKEQIDCLRTALSSCMDRIITDGQFIDSQFYEGSKKQHYEYRAENFIASLSTGDYAQGVPEIKKEISQLNQVLNNMELRQHNILEVLSGSLTYIREVIPELGSSNDTLLAERHIQIALSNEAVHLIEIDNKIIAI